MKIKNVEYRRQKTCLSIFADTYKDFAENTSIHGLKYTVKQDIGLYEKLFWILVVLSGLCGAGYMTVLFWERYTSNPTRTTILTAFAPTTAIAFPAVTLCNINRIIASKVDKFIEELQLSGVDASLAKRALPQLLAFTNPSSVPYNSSDLEMLELILSKYNIRDPLIVMSKISQSCKEMLKKCVWNSKEEECVKLFKESLTMEGICCSFNYQSDGKTMYTSGNGMMSGLLVVADTMIQVKQYSTLYALGFKVLIHTPQDFPGSDSIYKLIANNRNSYMQVMGKSMRCSSEVKDLPIEQRECVYPYEVEPLYFHDEYADTNCYVECEANHYFDVCECVPFYYAFSDKPSCNITSIPCLDHAKKLISVNEQLNCYCPVQCEDFNYEILMTSTRIDKLNTLHSPILREEDIPKDVVLLNIYFLSDTQTIMMRDTVTSTIYLLSSFGGVYSLFMGCSIMTIAEIIYFFVIRLVINLKFFGRVDNPVTYNDALKCPKLKDNNTTDNYYYFRNEPTYFLH